MCRVKGSGAQWRSPQGMAASKWRQWQCPWLVRAGRRCQPAFGSRDCRTHCGQHCQQEVVNLGLHHLCHQVLVFLGVQHQMGEHVGKTADVKRVVGMVAVAAMAAVVRMMLVAAMAIDFGFKNKSRPFRTIVVMVRHNGVYEDYRTCQSNHYFCSQMLHCMTFTNNSESLLGFVSRCKNTQFN